jgi:hypothetical protein
MTLSTHAVVGAAIASFLPSHPAASFVLGFASHFALDAIPHWDYPIRSACVDPKIGAPLVFDHALFLDAVTIGSDALFGILVAFVLFVSPESLSAVLLGALGAMLPDLLQFIHARFPHEPLRSLHALHRWAHTDREITDRIVLGIGSQLLLVTSIVALTAAAHGGFFSFAFATAAPVVP